MPLVRNTSNFNIRRRPRPQRREHFFSIAGPTTAASPIAISASAGLGIQGISDVSESTNGMRTYRKIDGYGREAKLEIFATAFMEVETYPLDPQSAFVMIRRVSPVMPDPLPLNDKGMPT